MRLSRHCYNKPHRCPGWIGGGTRWAKVHRCDNGRIVMDYDDPWRKWRFNRCDTCDVVCWPIVVRELDWRWWGWRLDSFWRFWMPEHVLWPVQKGIVIGLYTRPLKFRTLALKFDKRWKTDVWEEIEL
jgi:hypothetical protein